jgi:predicted metal-dependent hydrolase
MPHIDSLVPTEDLSGTWCNANAVTSSVMEAISFVTPVLENFFIATVVDGIGRRRDSALGQRCRDFIYEEANHSRSHRKFNSALLAYLGVTPPALALVQSLLNGARKRLSLSTRLLLVAALEHFAAVLSKGYLSQEIQWDFRSVYARELFIHHAREELAHRSVVFDLWLSKGTAGRIGRTLTVLTILFGGLVYISAAVPWILYRKTGKHLTATVTALARFVVGNRAMIKALSPLGELFSFVRHDFHPDRLIHESGSPGIQ